MVKKTNRFSDSDEMAMKQPIGAVALEISEIEGP